MFRAFQRSKHQLHSELDDIKGIGTISKEQLMKHFKSVRNIKAADIQSLTAVLGTAKATLLYNYFHPTDQNLNKK